MARRRTPDPLASYRDELNRQFAAIAEISKPAVRLDIVTRLGLVPVIFANGVDDDLPGLVAAIQNSRVLFGERIYEPGEPLVIERRILRASRRIFVVGPGHDGAGLSDEWVRAEQPADGRHVLLSHSDIYFNPVVLP